MKKVRQSKLFFFYIISVPGHNAVMKTACSFQSRVSGNDKIDVVADVRG